MKKSTSVALCGVMCAVSVVIMFLTSIVSIASYSLCAIAGMLLTVAVIEAGYKYAVTSYFVVAVLSGLFVADKEAVVLFCLFFGLYPILKGVIERLKKRPFEWALKMIFFNAAALGCYLLATLVLGIPAESYSIAGEAIPIVLLLLANVFFVVYDIAFTKLITLYLVRLQKNLHKRLGL